MLRWVAILIVIVNVIYFAVNYTSNIGSLPNPEVNVAAVAPSLVLLSEKKNFTVEKLVLPVAASVEKEMPKAIKSETTAILSPSGEIDAAPAVTFPLPEDQVAVADKKNTTSNDVAANKAPPKPVAESCWEVGKFGGEDEAKQLVVRLAAIGHKLALQKRAVQGEPDYWVFLGPYTNRRQALTAHRDLQVRKIDSFMINEGELENAVSLGLFSLETGAQTIQQQRKKQGLDAKIRAVPRTRSEWWGVLKQQDTVLPDVVRETILAGTADSVIEIKNLACELIANTEKLD